MPDKSTTDVEEDAHFPFIFLLDAFCPIGRVSSVRVSLSEISIGISGLDDDE